MQKKLYRAPQWAEMEAELEENFMDSAEELEHINSDWD